VSFGSIVFARFASTRLPGKALVEIGGRPMLGLVLDRARRVAGAPPLIVATSDRAEDDVIAAFVEKEGAACFRGDLDDVAGRALACADRYGLSRFARICGDRPFHDPGLIDRLRAMAESADADLATNAQRKTYPPGATAEVIRTQALRAALAQTQDAEDREHVTRYFYDRPDRFRIVNHEAAAGIDPRLSLVVDTPADLDRARFIAERLGDDVATATLERVLDLAAEWFARNASKLGTAA